MKFLLLSGVLLSLIGCTFSSGGPENPGANNMDTIAEKTAAKPLVSSLDTWGDQACAIVKNKLYCWGERAEKTLEQFGELKNPTVVSINAYHTCVIDDGNLKCVYVNYGNAPALKNVTQLVSGGNFACALSDGLVSCWGWNKGIDSIPTLKNPTQIAAGINNMCAITSDGVVCWGSKDAMLSSGTFNFSSPTRLSISNSFVCAIGSKGLECLGSYLGRIYEWTYLKKLNETRPTFLAVSDKYSCVIGSQGVLCESSYGFDFQGVTVPSFREPNLISLGGNYACAADADGVKCWGNNSKIVKSVPSFEPQKSPTAPSLNPSLSYNDITKGRCLKSWNWESSTSLVCLNQGSFSFFNIINKSPEKFALDLVGRNAATYRFETTSSTPSSQDSYDISLTHPDGNKLTFKGIDFGHSNYEPKAGYVVFDGNSGTCAPIVSGDRATCLKAIQDQSSWGDSINFEFFTFPKDTLTSVENCNLKATETFQSKVKFSVTNEKCSIRGYDYKKDDSITFDLRQPDNFPKLTLPYN